MGHVDFGSRARSIKILSQQLQQNVISNVLSKSIKSAATCHLECFITNPWVEKSAFKNLGNQYFRDMFRCVSIVIKLEGWCYLYGSSEMYFSVMLSCISLFAYLEVVLVVRGVARHFLFLYSPTISPPPATLTLLYFYIWEIHIHAFPNLFIYAKFLFCRVCEDEFHRTSPCIFIGVKFALFFSFCHVWKRCRKKLYS